MKSSILPYRFEKIPLLTQVILAIIFIPVQYAVSYFCSFVLKLPLFMDMIFLYAASFIGLPCGLIFSLGMEVFLTFLIHTHWINACYIVCHLTGVFIVRHYINKNDKIGLVHLVLISLFSILLISIEGGLIYTALSQLPENVEIEAVKYLTYSFLVQKIPLYLSAIFSRIPVNLVDKVIAVFAGFFIAVGVKYYILDMKYKRIVS